jgi:hypothetical protein
MKTKNVWVAACLSMVVGAWAGGAERSALPVSPTKGEYVRIADEVEANLRNQILDKFFPTAADEKGGGFFENYSLDWTRLPGDTRSIVYQSRLTWTSAQAAQRFPAKADMYLAMTRRGAAFLEWVRPEVGLTAEWKSADLRLGITSFAASPTQRSVQRGAKNQIPAISFNPPSARSTPPETAGPFWPRPLRFPRCHVRGTPQSTGRA